MKCPKCGYLGFERSDKCRNCGYEFSLAQPLPVPDLPMRSSVIDDVNPLEDLALIDAAAPARPAALADPSSAVRRHDVGASAARLPELPLFGGDGLDLGDDAPLITKASPPRPPLSVRRTTPEVPRLRDEPRPIAPMLDLASPELETDAVPPITPAARARAVSWKAPSDTPPLVPAGLMARLAAVAIDLGLLAAVDLAVVYFTVQMCGLSAAEISMLPKGPLLAFLLVQNGGYFVAFTAGGQTLGKVAAGIRVVSADPGGTPGLAHAVLRTLVWILLAIPAGLGFATALFSRDRRGLHDRCAGTRVVRAAA
jgi:uncharacterized RDD family membrane protein YckC